MFKFSNMYIITHYIKSSSILNATSLASLTKADSTSSIMCEMDSRLRGDFTTGILFGSSGVVAVNLCFLSPE